ncbi:MAG: hypothetical protein ACKOD2_03790 [Ilumatobacteraceae bacterium]
MRRSGAALLLALGVMMGGFAAPPVVAGAATPVARHAAAPQGVEDPVADATATTRPDLSCAKPAIVKPNCGVKPEQAGDRGGALQYTIWGLLLLALAVVFAVVFRSAARTNRRKTVNVAGRDWS